MAITSAICSSFKQELLQGMHSFESSGGSTFKIALFTLKGQCIFTIMII